MGTAHIFIDMMQIRNLIPIKENRRGNS